MSPYCDDFGGAVLNITIHRFAYAFVAPRNDDQIEFRATDFGVTEFAPLAAQVSTGGATVLHRGVYNRIVRDFNGGRALPVTITTHTDAPPGSGLGTSSAIVVALVDAFCTYLDLPLGRYDVARLAFEIERRDLGLAGGRQDQYAAAFGGANFIEFLADERVIVNPLRVRQGNLDELEASMLICFTGQSRNSNDIVVEQSSRMEMKHGEAIDALHRLKSDAIEMKGALLNGDIPGVADIMRRSWESKKKTASAVSNAGIDQLLDLAMRNGALAGKVSGAGGGGFAMLIAAPEARPGLLKILRASGLSVETVQFTEKGCETWIPILNQ